MMSKLGPFSERLVQPAREGLEGFNQSPGSADKIVLVEAVVATA
jgi:hypothetical protein